MGPLLVERSVYYREKASGAYSTFSYFLATGCVEAPFVLASGLIFASIFYW